MAALAPVHAVVAATVNLDHPGHYLHWGVVQISLANFIVILTMIAIFALAILLPFPKGRHDDDD